MTGCVMFWVLSAHSSFIRFYSNYTLRRPRGAAENRSSRGLGAASSSSLKVTLHVSACSHQRDRLAIGLLGRIRSYDN